jgi:hypothetical protein
MSRSLAAALVLAVASAAAAQSPAPAASAPPPFTRTAPDAAKGAALLEKAVAAHGGAAALDAVKSLEMRGSSTRILPGQEPIEMPSVTQLVIPDRYRHELTTKAGTISTLLNRDGAFVVLGAGALPLPPAEAAALRATSRRNLVALLRGRKDLRPAHVGSGRAGAVALEMVEVEVGGDKTVLGIDPQTGLVHQAIYSMPMGTGTTQVVATFADFRPLSNGVKYAFRSEGTVDGKPAFASRLESVVVNGAIEDRLFVAPPEPAEMPQLPTPSAPDKSPAPAPSPSPAS